MNTTKTKKWIVVLAGLLALVTGVAAFAKAYSHRVVESQYSEVYRRYRYRDDLCVAFVKDYRIGDSITVDVTTITAPDSASWERLLREMNVPEIIIRQYWEKTKQGTKGLGYYNCPHNRPEEKCGIEVEDIDLVYYSFNEKTLYIFDVQNKEQAHIIKHYQVTETFK